MRKFFIFSLVATFIGIGLWLRKAPRSQGLEEAAGELPAEQVKVEKALEESPVAQKPTSSSEPRYAALEKIIGENIPENWKGRLNFSMEPTSENRAKVFWTLDGQQILRSDSSWVFDPQKNEWRSGRMPNWSELQTVDRMEEPKASAVASALRNEFSQSELDARVVKIGQIEWKIEQGKTLSPQLPVNIEINRKGRSPSREIWDLDPKTLEVLSKNLQSRHGRPQDSLIKLKSDEEP